MRGFDKHLHELLEAHPEAALEHTKLLAGLPDSAQFAIVRRRRKLSQHAVARKVMIISLLGALVMLQQNTVSADSAAHIDTRTYKSENDEFTLTVSPQGNRYRPAEAQFRFESKKQGLLWERTSGFFEDFHFPLHVSISNDGKYFVFGGFFVHNLIFDAAYHEGIRIYTADGKLVRFVSRRDLPQGGQTVSTVRWYDYKRSRIEGNTFLLFTPGKEDPQLFDLATGNIVKGTSLSDQMQD